MTTDPLAQAAVVAYCGWDPTVQVTDQTVLLDGNGTSLLVLPSLHVTGVSAVTFTDQWGSTTARTVAPTATPAVGDAPTADVGWSENGCLIWNGCDYGGWPVGQRNIAVIYSGGYASIPADIQAVLDSISRRTGGPNLGAVSTRMGTAAVTFGQQLASGGLLLVETMVLDRYRIPRVA